MQELIRSQLLALNSQFYQEFAGSFSATRHRLQPGVALLAARLLSAKPAQRLLDLGCGNGSLARHLLKTGYQGTYLGLDNSQKLLEEARTSPPSPLSVYGEGADHSNWPWYTNHELWEKLKPLAREKRHEPTMAEQMLWRYLRNRQLSGYKFRRQHSFDRFIVDFYSPNSSLIIEVDGPIHEYTADEDSLRTEYLHSFGLRILRFTNEEVLNNINIVIQQIEKSISTFSPSPFTERGSGGEVSAGSGGEVSSRPGGEVSSRPGGVVDSKPVPVPSFSFLNADLSSPTWDSLLPPEPFDMIMAFAVLHHIPGADLRLRLLRQMRTHLRPGGSFIHSVWQFMNSPRLSARVRPWASINIRTEDLEPGDTLLDWRSGGEGLRYVHLFNEVELYELARNSGFHISETFYSDGKEGNLGLYQVWQAD